MTGNKKTFTETSFKTQGPEDALVIKCEDGWRVIPRVPDAQKLYIEVTTG